MVRYGEGVIFGTKLSSDARKTSGSENIVSVLDIFVSVFLTQYVVLAQGRMKARHLSRQPGWKMEAGGVLARHLGRKKKAILGAALGRIISYRHKHYTYF